MKLILKSDFHAYMKTLNYMIMYLIVMAGVDLMHESIVFSFMC
jgi:hypothetical protein